MTHSKWGCNINYILLLTPRLKGLSCEKSKQLASWREPAHPVVAVVAARTIPSGL
jgi:hypothetical protein